MKKLKIILPIVALAILFVISFVLQSKYNALIMDQVNAETAESVITKQILLFGSSFVFLNILIFSIVACFVVIFLILVSVLVNRNKMERRARIKEELTEVYQKLILDYIDDKVLMDEKEFKKICNSRFKRNILINQIIDVGLMMPNTLLEHLTELYFRLGLNKETKRKLYSRKWHNKIKAMKELSSLQIPDYNDEILKSINAKNSTLRMEAQIAMVRLSDEENPFGFLEHLDHDFSVWEQITLHELIEQAEIPVPDFSKWLISDNHTVGMFCLRMMREYKQFENIEALNNMLYHPDDKVVRFAIEVVGDLKIDGLTKNLKDIYKHEPYLNALEIVKTMGKIGDPKTIKFIQHVVDSEEDTQLQIEGVKAINSMGEEGKTALHKMVDSDYKDYKIIIKHVLDNRIN